MYAACSTTARRGALDWAPEFEKANRPVFEAVSPRLPGHTQSLTRFTALRVRSQRH